MPTSRLNGAQIANYSSYPTSVMRAETFFDKNEIYIYWYEPQISKFMRADIPTLANVTQMGSWDETGYLSNTFDPNSATALLIVKSSGIYRLEPSTMIETLLMSAATFDGIVGGAPTLSQCGLICQGINNTILISARSAVNTNQIWVFDPLAITLLPLFSGGVGIYIGGISLGINSSTDITFTSNVPNAFSIFNRNYSITDEITLIAGSGASGMTDGEAYLATFGNNGFLNLWRAGSDLIYVVNNIVYETMYLRWIQNNQVGTYPSTFIINNFLPKNNLGILCQTYNLYLYN